MTDKRTTLYSNILFDRRMCQNATVSSASYIPSLPRKETSTHNATRNGASTWCHLKETMGIPVMLEPCWLRFEPDSGAGAGPGCEASALTDGRKQMRNANDNSHQSSDPQRGIG